MTQIIIEKYSENYKNDVINLILNIQQNEFGVNISLQDQPDLQDIKKFYQSGKSNFWIAKTDSKVAGTIALLDIGKKNGALRKMFVSSQFRGSQFGVGQTLLNTVLKWSSDKNFEKILLGTTEKFVAAQRFYEKNNFLEIDKNQLPIEFPIMKVDVKFYEYKMKKNEKLP